MHPGNVEAVASWVNSVETQHHVWSLCLNAPEPLGYHPAQVFVSPDHETYQPTRCETADIRDDTGL